VDLDVSTRAALKLAFLPPGILLLLLLVGWLFARRFFGRLLLFIGIALFYGLSTPIAVDWLASQLESMPAKNADELKRARADAILVFLAGASENNPEWGGGDALSSTSLARLDYALAIHRETGLPILLSGGSPFDKTRPVAALGAEWLQQRVGITPAAIDTASHDTWENAQQSRELLEQLGYTRVILVTHASHMPRSRLSARAAGLDVVPAPFGFIHTPPEYREAWELEDYLPKPGRLLDSYRVLHEILGLLWYGFNLGSAES
jgi:uncharacterized SAM-binding protein YcdF (DUF218 family)